MRVTLKQLKNLEVETVSGTHLGKIFDIVFEIDGQLVAQYEVKSSILSTKKYLISRDQLVRFESEKIIVDDNVGEIANKKEEEKIIAKPEPVAMIEEV